MVSSIPEKKKEEKKKRSSFVPLKGGGREWVQEKPNFLSKKRKGKKREPIPVFRTEKERRAPVREVSSRGGKRVG